jgi:hypothetical protein
MYFISTSNKVRNYITLAVDGPFTIAYYLIHANWDDEYRSLQISLETFVIQLCVRF